MAREQLKNLTEPMYYILLSLIKENHGYGIMQMVDEITEGRVAIGAGTLYSLLGRFEKEEIIIQVAEANRRKTYQITEKGSAILREEYARLNNLVSDGKRFFEFDGQPKEPPNDGGGGGEKEESICEVAKKENPEKAEKEKKMKLPRKGLNYGGAF